MHGTRLSLMVIRCFAALALLAGYCLRAVGRGAGGDLDRGVAELQRRLRDRGGGASSRKTGVRRAWEGLPVPQRRQVPFGSASGFRGARVPVPPGERGAQLCAAVPNFPASARGTRCRLTGDPRAGRGAPLDTGRGQGRRASGPRGFERSVGSRGGRPAAGSIKQDAFERQLAELEISRRPGSYSAAAEDGWTKLFFDGEQRDAAIIAAHSDVARVRPGKSDVAVCARPVAQTATLGAPFRCSNPEQFRSPARVVGPS